MESTNQHSPWWMRARYQLLELADKNSPCFVYSKSYLQHQVLQLKNCSAVNKIFFSVKSNSHPEILNQFYHSEIGFECVSLQEVYHILKLFPNINKNRILFTPNFAAKNEYHQALALDILITIDNLYILTHWGSEFHGKNILIRIDIGEGRGHHKYVITGGHESKFGIAIDDLKQALNITKKHEIHVVGLHSHSGSGILQNTHWRDVFSTLEPCFKLFPEATTVDLGGGLGIVERAEQLPLNLKMLNNTLLDIKKNHPHLQIWLEPGRYLVAESGVLLAKVTQTKTKGPSHFVGIETGMNSLLRPMLYDSYHVIVNLTRLEEPATQRVDIVGPICESGDTLGRDRLLPLCQEDDILLIANVGAYGYSMSSHYNLRDPAQEYYAENL